MNSSRPSVRLDPMARRSPTIRMAGAFVLVGVLLVTALWVNASKTAAPHATIRGTKHPGRPLRVLMVGDSLSGTLGVGLAEAAKASNIELTNAARPACSVEDAFEGTWSSTLFIPGPAAHPCESKGQLEGFWRKELRRFQPDVVIYASRMDLINQYRPHATGPAFSIADPSHRGAFTADLVEATKLLSSTGALVILTNSAPTKSNLVGSPQDDPARLVVYNEIVKEVAARSQGRAVAFNLAGAVGGPGEPPSFTLTSPAGIQWRCSDGIHIAPAGGIIVAPKIFSLAWKLGRHRVETVKPTTQPEPSQINQPWQYFGPAQTRMGCPSS